MAQPAVSPLISTFGGGEVSPLLVGRSDLQWYPNACQRLRNMVALTEGAATRRPPTRFVSEVANSANPTIVRRFEFNDLQPYVVELGNTVARLYANKGIVVDGSNNPIVVTTPYASAQLAALKFVQSADVLFIFHPAIAPQQLERQSATSWSMVAMEFEDGPYLEINTSSTTLSPAAASGSNIAITASAPAGINNGAGFGSGDVGRFVRLGYLAAAWAAATAYSPGDVVQNAASGVYICRVGGTSAPAGSTGPTGTNLGVGDGSVLWDYVNAGGVYYGYAQITSINNATSVQANILVTLAGSGATAYWRLGLYSPGTGYPACGALWQQRMLMAGCPNNPDRIDGSVTADYPNFTPGDTDDDPVSYTLGLDTVDPIYWLGTKRVLFAGTLGSVQKAFGTNGYDSAVTPSAIDVVEQVKRGAANLAPVRVVNGLVYLHRMGRKFLELYYDFTLDIDTATELTARARHMTGSGIVDFDYQQEPYSTLWAARGDGQVAAVTYYREQQFIAWHLHQLGGGGIVESLCCIPGPPAAPGVVGGDQVWMVVRRTINGQTKRYIEVLDDFNAVDDSAQVADANLFFGDCYSVYSGSPATIISGLGFLEGMPVVVLGDGQAYTGLTVTGGQITLPQAHSTVYVGLDYSNISYLEPMPIEPSLMDGSPKGAMKRVDRLTVGLYRSGPFTCGDGCGAPSSEDPRIKSTTDVTAVPALKTGPYQFAFNGTQDLVANIVFQPVGPLPLTVLWMSPRISGANS